MHLRHSRLVSAGLVLVVLLAGLVGWHWSDSDPAWIFWRAERAFQARRFTEAARALERLRQVRAPTPVDRFLLAEVDAGLKRPAQALDQLAAIPDDHPLAPLARLLAGQLEIRQGRTRPAEASLLTAIRLLPRALQPRKELVYIYNIQHRQTELDAQLAALLDLDALDFQYILHWTKTRNTTWNAAGDLPALEKFVAADPEDRWSRLALVEGLRRLDRLAEAEAVLSALPASDLEARVQRTLLAIDRGDFAAAASLLGDGPDDHPKLALLRGQLALRRRDGHAAVHHFRIALAKGPVDRAALAGLGTALRLVDKPEEARRHLHAAQLHDGLWALVARAATAEGERDPELPRKLGMACAAIGRTQEARAWLKLAVKHDPLDERTQELLFELERGAPLHSTGRSLPHLLEKPLSCVKNDRTDGVLQRGR
jgi:tetratricopeptide (TPR) repeat protein